jgi:hypothetical protein
MSYKISEYKDTTIEYIMEVTGLVNQWSDGSKYSQYRQKQLLLREAYKQNLLYRVRKSHPIEDTKQMTNVLKLNQLPHKVKEDVRGNIVIEIYKKDIPSNIQPLPNPKAAYHVIDTFGEDNCYYDVPTYSVSSNNVGTRVGIRYKFVNHKNVTLHIITS